MPFPYHDTLGARRVHNTLEKRIFRFLKMLPSKSLSIFTLDKKIVRIYLGKLTIMYIGENAQLQRFVLQVGRRLYEPYSIDTFKCILCGYQPISRRSLYITFIHFISFQCIKIHYIL